MYSLTFASHCQSGAISPGPSSEAPNNKTQEGKTTIIRSSYPVPIASRNYHIHGLTIRKPAESTCLSVRQFTSHTDHPGCVRGRDLWRSSLARGMARDTACVGWTTHAATNQGRTYVCHAAVLTTQTNCCHCAGYPWIGPAWCDVWLVEVQLGYGEELQSSQLFFAFQSDPDQLLITFVWVLFVLCKNSGITFS